MSALSDIVEWSFELLFRPRTIGIQERTSTVVNNALERVKLDLNRTTMLDETIYKQVDKFVKACKAAEAGRKSLLPNDYLLTLTLCGVQTKTRGPKADQQKVTQLVSKSELISVNENTVVAAMVSVV